MPQLRIPVVGSNALSNLTTGDDNIAVGTNALSSAGSGSGNAGVGSNSLRNLWSGNDNAALGEYSLYNLGYGSVNVGIGYNAGFSNYSGSANTYIGAYSGSTDGSVTTPDGLWNATAIGYNAQVLSSRSLILGGTGEYAVNVGIGTAAPVVPLEVNGVAQFDDPTGQNQPIIIDASSGTFTVNGQPLVTMPQGVTTLIGLDENGNLGIGVSNPDQQLTLSGNLEIPATSWSGGAIYQDGAPLIQTPNSTNLFFGKSSGSQYSISTANAWFNVGVGANTMSYLSSGAYYNVAVGYSALYRESTGNYNTAVGWSALTNTSSGASNTGLGGGALYNNITGNNNTAIGFAAMDFNRFGTGNTALGYEALWGGGTAGITQTSNVAVGQTALYSAKTVTGNTALGTQALYGVTTGNYNIGIGSSSGSTVTTGIGNIVIGNSVSVPNVAGNYQLNIGNLIFSNAVDGNGTTLSTGNIGIGTTNPTKKLHVVGAAEFDNPTDPGQNVIIDPVAGLLKINGQSVVTLPSGVSSFVPEGNTPISVVGSNYGIGVSNPDQQLTLSGNLELPASSATAGAIYQNGAPLISTYGTDNQFFGHDAGNFQTTGTDNVGLGSWALLQNTTGSSNIAIGTNALVQNTGGGGNIAIGTNTLAQDTTGWANIAIGQDALQADQNTHSNVAIGFLSMSNTNYGYNNTAVGGGALQNNTGLPPSENAPWTGSGNIAFGSGALTANTIGADNAALGTGALTTNTTGYHNIAIGSSVLSQMQTGGYNIAIGTSAAQNISSGSSNVIIGENVQAPVQDGSLQLDIANVIFGTGMYNPGAKIGIGTSSPAQTLDVFGAAQFDDPTPNSQNPPIIIDPVAQQIRINGKVIASTPSGGGGYISLGNGVNVFSSGDVGLGTTSDSGQQLTITGNLELPSTVPDGNGNASGGAIYQGSVMVLSTYTPPTGVSNNLYNTFLGSYSGNTSLNSSDNVGVGGFTLHALSTGIYNTAIGGRAGANLTSGSFNVAVGEIALHSAIDNSGEVAVGQGSLWQASHGGSNTAVGVNSLYNLSAGTSNTAIGSNALFYTVPSTSNQGFNTALGASAGTQNQTGQGNTFLGAGANSGSATNLTNATAIGYNAQVTATNALVLGQTAQNGVQVNVGIGTTAPSVPLEVAGTAQFDNAQGQSVIVVDPNAGTIKINNLQVVTSVNGAANFVPIYANGLSVNATTGYVGIGAGLPTSGLQQLTITGNFELPATSSSGGNLSGAIYQGTTVVFNTYTPTGAGGLYNTFLGASSGNPGGMSANTGDNVGVGERALSSLTTGGSNTVAGGQVAQRITTGSNNVAIGDLALNSATTDSQEVAIGRGALQASFNSSSQGNTSNTAVGDQALNQLVVGNGNTAVGSQALAQTNHGSAAVANNTAMGSNAGSRNTTGQNNTFVGASAGSGTTTSANLTNATAIGYNAQVAQSNSLVLGAINPASGISTTYVGIGTTTPSAPLHVSGTANFTKTVHVHAGGDIGMGSFSQDPSGFAPLQ